MSSLKRNSKAEELLTAHAECSCCSEEQLMRSSQMITDPEKPYVSLSEKVIHRRICIRSAQGANRTPRPTLRIRQTFNLSMRNRQFCVAKRLFLSISSDVDIKSRNKTCSTTCNEKSSMPMKYCAPGVINRRQCARSKVDCNRYHCSM